MRLNPENRALKALLWFVILFVPGGLFLLAFLAADEVHRRYREGAGAPEPDLANGSLSGVSSRT
jgi:hypothetical protein